MRAIDTLAEFCRTLSFESLPQSVTDRAKLLVIDVCGNTVGGRSDRCGQILGEYVLAQGGRPEATFVASRSKYPVANVILAHCALAHSQELDDTHNAACAHIGAALVPSALAVAELVGASGKDLILAVALGSEVTTRVAAGLNPPALYARGYHPSSISAPFGVATAVGRLLGLTQEQMIDAWGLAGVQSSGLLCGSGAMSWYLQYGRSAQSGFYAAHFARAGLNGPADIFHGQRGLQLVHGPHADLGGLTRGLGSDWALDGLSFKMRACLHFGQASIDALFNIMDEHRLSHGDIESIRLHLPSTAFDIIDPSRYPATRLEAQARPSYIMSVAAIDRKVTPAQYAEERISDGQVKDLAGRVEVVADVDLDAMFPARWPAIVDVVTKDGTTYTCLVRNARGDADNPPSRDEIVAKFLDLVGEALARERVDDFLSAVDHLESLADVSSLASILGDAVTKD